MCGGESPTPNKKFWGKQIWVFVFFFGSSNSLSIWRIYFFLQNQRKTLHQTFVIRKRFFGHKN